MVGDLVGQYRCWRGRLGGAHPHQIGIAGCDFRDSEGNLGSPNGGK